MSIAVIAAAAFAAQQQAINSAMLAWHFADTKSPASQVAPKQVVQGELVSPGVNRAGQQMYLQEFYAELLK